MTENTNPTQITVESKAAQGFLGRIAVAAEDVRLSTKHAERTMEETIRLLELGRRPFSNEQRMRNVTDAINTLNTLIDMAGLIPGTRDHLETVIANPNVEILVEG